ncbi:MAG: isopentenyl-diphosphate Delta-isomerase [Candidatus Aenigmarchaeota archaeon]|nr:isopentenyl-diphosphate Delta-isomerase [Candidatus Aenigmarchaeota archaeon]
MSDTMVLVDENDREIGFMEKMEAHEKAKLHRAFSVFVFNSKGEMLIQQRAKNKYHCGGLWTNACCSHPRKGEKTEDAAHRRLKDEMGFDCGLKEIFSFVYKAPFDNGLTEHEFDHVFVGEYGGEVAPDKNEVEDCKWISVDEIRKDMKEHPERYTPWFRICLERVLKEK